MLSKKHRRNLDLAMRVAEDSDVNRCQHGAVVVKNGNVLAVASNKRRNDPRYSPPMPDGQQGQRFSVHAEVAAIRRLRGGAEGATLYVARSRDGVESLSKPCRSCSAIIADAGIKKIIHT